MHFENSILEFDAVYGGSGVSRERVKVLKATLDAFDALVLLAVLLKFTVTWACFEKLDNETESFG